MTQPVSSPPARRLLMDDYLAGTLRIFSGLGGELEHIGELTSRAASVLRGGGKVYASMNYGHLPVSETASGRRGNPGLMTDHGGWASTDFGIVQSGDMVFTNACARRVQAARDRGAYIVAVTCSYTDNEFRPPGITCPNEENLMLRDVASDILHSHVPYEQGLCRAPQIPGVTLCASAGTGAGTLFWMLNAELANKLADDQAPVVGRSAEYLAVVRARVEALAAYRERIRQTAVTMAERVLDGGTWHAQSLEYPGLASDLQSVECGPIIVNNRPWDPARPNVLLVSAVSADFADEVRLAAARRQEGAFVIVVGPTAGDQVTPTPGLLAVADVGFDNLSPEADGVIAIAGRATPICPASAMVGNVIQQMICAQWADEMIQRDAPPVFYRGINQVGSKEFNEANQRLLERRGY